MVMVVGDQEYIAVDVDVDARQEEWEGLERESKKKKEQGEEAEEGRLVAGPWINSLASQSQQPTLAACLVTVPYTPVLCPVPYNNHQIASLIIRIIRSCDRIEILLPSPKPQITPAISDPFLISARVAGPISSTLALAHCTATPSPPLLPLPPTYIPHLHHHHHHYNNNNNYYYYYHYHYNRSTLPLLQFSTFYLL
ncbi:uncharacterized protein PADG_12001 [Paracoccidioides brasiliensis Pb18]|uniref:Uncharacterized protein n=1 Tax=Paracoccidioides brasiliensis (strain Pb18) TaxID=502780 RepID=A0A0A0HT81_PARBD|nr:uncharacterized protein PADG_12001 [Paracoccidioides brasiliensis Pb18]KGM91862.1 hypothetical protein PADG_12001 [Paracoccidioides brasiliensis Pb18]